MLCLVANTIKEHRWFFNTKFISEVWYATHYHARSLQISYNSVEDITDDIRKQIGWRIQEKRIEKGITAVDLSTYLNITANQVSRIERGCAGIDIYKLIVICKILGVSADYILFGEMKEENITISKEQFEAINGLISMFGKEKL